MLVELIKSKINQMAEVVEKLDNKSSNILLYNTKHFWYYKHSKEYRHFHQSCNHAGELCVKLET